MVSSTSSLQSPQGETSTTAARMEPSPAPTNGACAKDANDLNSDHQPSVNDEIQHLLVPGGATLGTPFDSMQGIDELLPGHPDAWIQVRLMIRFW